MKKEEAIEYNISQLSRDAVTVFASLFVSTVAVTAVVVNLVNLFNFGVREFVSLLIAQPWNILLVAFWLVGAAVFSGLFRSISEDLPKDYNLSGPALRVSVLLVKTASLVLKPALLLCRGVVNSWRFAFSRS